jgi:hypothetical protein
VQLEIVLGRELLKKSNSYQFATEFAEHQPKTDHRWLMSRTLLLEIVSRQAPAVAAIYRSPGSRVKIEESQTILARLWL